MRSAKPDGGMSLILVITILSALLALALPFALSMKLQDRSTQAFANEARARLSARAGVSHAQAAVMRTHPAYERQQALSQGDQASLGEDLDDLDELLVTVDGFDGIESWETRSATGTMLSVDVRDAQGQVNLNACAPYLLGNLIGATVLLEDVDEESESLPIENPTVFFSDGNPQTLDGIVAVDRELVLYRHIDLAERRLVGLVRFPFDDAGLRHGEGTWVRDARYLKAWYHPFLAEWGKYRPYETVAGLRQVANWSFVDLFRILPGYRPALFQPSVVRRSNLSGEDIRLLGLDREWPGFTPGEPQNLEGGEMKRLRAFLAAFAEIRRKPAQAAHIEAFTPGELARLYDLLTVHSRGEVVWSDPQRINHDVNRGNDQVLQQRLRVADASAFRFPSIARIGPPGGPYQYRMAIRNPRNNQIFIWPWLNRGYRQEEAFISARPPAPINLNTASHEVLTAMWSVPGRNGQTAWETASSVIEARPLSNDIDHLGAVGFPLTEQSLRRWTLWLIEGGAPRCYESFGVFELDATAIESGDARNQLASYRVRQVFDAVPPVETAWSIDSQDDFLATVNAGPVPDNNFWRTNRGNVPRSGRAGGFVITGPSREFQVPMGRGDPSHDENVGDLRIRHLVEPENNSPLYFESWNDEPEGERFRGSGLDLGVGSIPVGDLFTPEGDPIGQGWAPFQVSFWVRPAGSGSGGTLVEVGQEDDPYNQLLLTYDSGNELLRLSLWDGALDVSGGGRSIDLIGSVQMRPNNWYHVLFQVWGTRVGEQTLFVDGKAVGEHVYRTYLTQAEDAEALSFTVEDASELFPPNIDDGPVLIGREIVEVTRAGNVLQVNRQIQNPAFDPNDPQASQLPPIIRGGSRGSTPTAHDEHTVVQPFGYTASCTDRVPIAGGTLTQPLEPVMPWTLADLADSVLIPILDSTGTTLPVVPELGTANFPPQGVIAVISFDLAGILAGNLPTAPNIEVMAYDSHTGDAFEGLQRDVIPNQGSGRVNHYSLALIVLLSIEASDTDDYADVDAASRYPWVQLTNAPDHEWIHYYKGSTYGFDNFLILPVDPGNHMRFDNLPADIQPLITDVLRHFAQLVLGQNPPGDAVLPDNANEIPLTSVADSLIPYTQSIQPTTELTCRDRHDKGTAAQAWAGGALLCPVWSTNSDLVRDFDPVTITDAVIADPQREELEVLHTAGANARFDMCAPNARRLAAFNRFVGRDYEPAAAARVLRWPTGDLADLAPTGANLLQGRPGSPFGARLPGDLDEVAVHGLNVTSPTRLPGEGPVVQGTGIDVFHGPVLTTWVDGSSDRLPFDPSWNAWLTQGGLIMVGPEVLAADAFGGSGGGGGSGTPVVRGLLASRMRGHSSETRGVRLTFPGMAQTSGYGILDEQWTLYSQRNLRALDGYVAVDQGRGRGFGEVFPYTRVVGNNQGTQLERPVDELGNAVYRGAFGSGETGVAQGDILINIPARFHSRYREETSGYEGVFYQFTVPLNGAWVDRIEWDERRNDPLCGADILVVARLDGYPHWDAGQNSSPRADELYEFREPNRDNRIGRTADQIEIRVYFPYRNESFEDDAWKTTPVLEAIRIYTRQPSRVLAHEEGDEWR